MPVLRSAKELLLNYNYSPDTWESLKEIEDYVGSDDDYRYYDGENTHYFEEITNEVIASSLGYYIELVARKVQEDSLAIGASKLEGIPHLPQSWNVPDDYKFYAQLNIAEFKRFDIEDEFPESGIVYFFKDGNANFNVLFYDGPTEELEITEYKNSNKGTYALQFSPHCVFYFSDYSNYYSDIPNLLPEELKEQIEVLVKCEIEEEDADFKIFGRPKYWQNEDYIPPKVEGSISMPSLKDIMMSKSKGGTSASADQQKDIEVKKPKILLLQNDHGEGSIHFWIAPADLKNKAFNKVWVTYSGT